MSAAEIGSVVSWYLLLAALGWLALPIAYRCLPALPLRGYPLLRPLALLLWGFLFWILSSFGLLGNQPAGLLTAALLLAGIGYAAWQGIPAGELGGWLRKQRGSILATELIFLLAFLFMLAVRLNNPDIVNTEKFMEMAFVNAILHSPAMPPHDPWLSGFSISYYYFGYLLVAMLARLLNVAGAVAFNLGLVTVFAMAAVAAYGLVFDLLTLYKPAAVRSLRWLAGLAPLLMLLMGNAEGLLEIAHARHLFWETNAAGERTSSFWQWLDIKDLVNPPGEEPRWAPRLYGQAWWWWRASRVINDRTFSGGEQELIDEFPAFSFVLGDLHPHVLSMPFVLLATSLALNLYLGGAERKQPLLDLHLRGDALALGALAIGGLAFLNIWDLPIYAILFAGAYALRRAQVHGWDWARLKEFLKLLLLVGLGGVLLYLPFYLGFTSQAGGILPNLINPTRGTHLWVMFVTLLAPLVLFAAWVWKQRGLVPRLPRALLVGLGFVLVLWAASASLAWLYAALLAGSPLGEAILSGLGAADTAALFAESLRRRLSAAGGWLTLGLLLGLFGGLLALAARRQTKQPAPAEQARNFALLLALVSALLVTAPEFIYLRDQFGTRMNTVFKFYMQAWLMWSVAASFGAVVLLTELRRVARAAALVVLLFVFGAGLVYPVYAFSDVASRPEGRPLTLDGSTFLPLEAREAIAWLQHAQPGVLAEAVGGSYTGFARYATFSGQPSVMGWPGHEGQWRGGNVDFGRITDIETLYSTADWATAQAILERYNIRYVVVGDLERSSYAVNEAKFQARLQPAFQNGLVTIYIAP